MKGLIILFFLLSFSPSFGEEDGKSSLRSLEDFSQLGQALNIAQMSAKQATICIDLGDGSSGSGVIVSPEGLVLSAAHVTQEVGKKFMGVLEDGTEYEMVALGLDTSHDASLAQIILPEGVSALPYVKFSHDLQLGQYVFALGHAGGFDVKRGSVVRLGRILEVEDTSLRTDCVLIGGDSGGPLFNLDGELIGIHSRVGTVTNSNTHVPIKVYEDQWDALLAGKLLGDGTYADAGIPFLGMHLLQKGERLEVTSITENSRAEKLKVALGDVLLSFNGTEVFSGKDLLNALQEIELTPQGVEITLAFLRNEKEVIISCIFNE